MYDIQFRDFCHKLITRNVSYRVSVSHLQLLLSCSFKVTYDHFAELHQELLAAETFQRDSHSKVGCPHQWAALSLSSQPRLGLYFAQCHTQISQSVIASTKATKERGGGGLWFKGLDSA